MNTLTHLFDWLLAASLRASFLTLAVLLIQAAFHRHLGARMRYVLWLPVLIVLLMPVLPQSQWSIEHVFQPPPPPVQIIPAPISPAMESTPVVFKAPAPMPAPINWQRIRLISWLSVSAGMLTLGSISFFLTLHRFKKARHPASDELLATLAQIAREMHLRHVPRVLIASAVGSPAVTGLLRPTLLLPADFDREFTPAEARLVLKHELMHLKRGDLPLNALMCVLMALHWFNPLLWIAFFKIRADREAACDAQVLRDATKDHRVEYGHALLKVETAFCPRGFSLGFVGIFQRGSALRFRIQSIATHRTPHPATQILVTLCIFIMTFLGITRAASSDGSTAPLISIQAHFIELTVPSDEPSAAGSALAELLAEIEEPKSDGRSLKTSLTDAQYQILIRKLSQKKGVDLLAMPTMTVRSGQKASMEVTRDFASPPEQKPPGQKVGVTLDVLPTLTDKDSLELTMQPRVVEFEGFVKTEKGEQKTIYNERKADTTTKMKLGQTALIDVGSRIDSQTIEDRIDGKVTISTLHLTRRVFAFVTARSADKTVKDSSKTVFTTGKSTFRPGDSLRITSMTRSDDMLTVELEYELSSTDEATAALYITTKDKASDGSSPTFDSRQHAFLKRGRGSLVLHHPQPYKGLPHVTLYDTKTRQPIGGLYFGTEAEATDSQALDLSYMTSSIKSKTGSDVIRTKLEKIIIPHIQFQGATVEECLEYLRVKSRAHDTSTADPAARGVSILYKAGNPPSKAAISLDLKDTPLGEALRYVVELASLKMSLQPYAVLVGSPEDPDFAKSATASDKDTTEIIQAPLSNIVIPSIEFRDATLDECIDFVCIKSREFDPDKKGVNIVLKSGGDASARITLSLKNVPLSEALRYCAELANHKLTSDDQSFFITPISTEPPAKKDQASTPAAPPTPPNAAEVKAAELRKARPQQYDFAKANLGDVLRFLATDSSINFISLPDDNPINQRLLTFSIKSSPFEVLETLCRANGLMLVLDQDRWFIRPNDDSEQITKAYALPKTQASVETILEDIASILGGDETKPAADKPHPSVTFKKEQNSVSIKATRMQHFWVSGYFKGLSGAAQSAKTK